MLLTSLIINVKIIYRTKQNASFETIYTKPMFHKSGFIYFENTRRNGDKGVDCDELARKLKELGLGVKTELIEQVSVDPSWFQGL